MYSSNAAESLKKALSTGNSDQSRNIIKNLQTTQEPEIISILVAALKVSAIQYVASQKLLKAQVNIIPFLLPLLNEEDPNIKLLTLGRLKEIKDTNSVPAIINSLVSDKDARVRAKAAFALSSFDSHEVLVALATALETEKSPFAMVSIADAIGYFKKPLAVNVLLKTLEKEQNVEVKREIVNSLGKIGDKSLLDLFSQILINEKEEAGTKSRAALSLGRIGSQNSIPLLETIVLDENESGIVRGSAAQALALLHADASVSVLVKAFRDSEDVFLQEDVLKALIDLNVDPIAGFLIEVALNPQKDAQSRVLAIIGLGELEQPMEQVITSLRSLIYLEDDNKVFDNIPIQAILSLENYGEIGNQELDKILEEGNSIVIDNIIKARQYKKSRKVVTNEEQITGT